MTDKIEVDPDRVEAATRFLEERVPEGLRGCQVTLRTAGRVLGYYFGGAELALLQLTPSSRHEELTIKVHGARLVITRTVAGSSGLAFMPPRGDDFVLASDQFGKGFRVRLLRPVQLHSKASSGVMSERTLSDLLIREVGFYELALPKSLR